MSKKISKEELHKKYIEENKSIDECAIYFSVSRTTIKNRIREFALNKPKNLIKQLVDDRKPIITKEIIDKRKKVWLEKYGVDNPMKVESIKEKTRATNIEKYGVDNPNKNSEVLNKRAKTNIERYGHISSLGNKTIQEKARERCLEIYGDIYPLRSDKKDVLLKKRKKTNIEKYGTEEITNSQYFKEKVSERCQKLYGTDSPNESIYSGTIFSSRENFEIFLNDNNLEKPTISDLVDLLNVSDTYILKKIHHLSAIDLITLKPKSSKGEKEVIQFLKEIGILEEEINIRDREALDGLELDIFIPKFKLAIEFNGTYWHSDKYKERKYHQEKSLLSEKAGIQLIHIYEYEWNDKHKRDIIKSIIINRTVGNKNKIYARKCAIKKVDKKDEKEFLNENHLQGFRGSNVAYGLYYNDELVQIMTFGRNKLYGWEIIREVSKKTFSVIGGTSKILNKFLEEYKPETVFSYADFNKFSGRSYEMSGMEFIGITVPDMKWVINGKVFNRNPSKHKQLKNLSECKIFGAGSKKYLLKNDINFSKDNGGNITV